MAVNNKESSEIALQERIKELNCLYGMTRLAEENGSIPDFLKRLADFLPAYWRYADIACARITFLGDVFESKTFKSTDWHQSAPIRLDGEIAGELSIYYLHERPTADEGPFLIEERKLLEEIAQRISEIAVRAITEKELQENNNLLLMERKALQEANAVLRTVLSNIEDEKRRIYENVQLSIDNVIMPILHSLTPAVAKDKRKYVEILKANLEEITSPYVNRLLYQFRALTPTEVNICNMIRSGLRNKEIAELRGISAATVDRHREHIRRKLEIANRKINLTTYLQSLLSAGDGKEGTPEGRQAEDLKSTRK